MTSFQRLATLDRTGQHTITPSAEQADLVLFTEAHVIADDWRRRSMREHPLRRTFPERCLAYDETDEPWCWLPGVYVSMPAPYMRHRFQVAGSYYQVPPAAGPDSEPDLLFSFVGSIRSHASRRGIPQLRHDRSLIEDTYGFVFFDPSSDRYEERRRRFAVTLSRSKFVLCPRGRGSSSIRLYEALAAGRVPVIVSDHWVPPPGPRWADFSVRVPEADVASIPRLLEGLEERWPTLSAEARRAYSEWFAPDIAFHRIVDACRGLQEQQAPSSFPNRGLRGRRFFSIGFTTLQSRARRTVVELRSVGRSALRPSRASR